MNNGEVNKKKEPKRKLAIRIVCLVLAITMVASTFFYILSYLFTSLGA